MAAPAKRFWHLESFTGGLDRRDGVYTKNQNRFWDLVNYRIVNAKKAIRRPPCGRHATQHVNCQGLVEWRGALYTVAKKGDVVTKPATVTGELRFDNPDHCTTWELAGLQTFAGYPVALIKHTYPGGDVTHQYRLHVFDGKKNKPTYVEDPWCPIGWGPKLPLHAYRTGDLGAFDPAWEPRLKECKGRLYITMPDGNTAFSKTGNPRTWNERTADQIADQGEWWYFITNSTSGIQEFIVSESYANTQDLNAWVAGVLEYCDADGTWHQMEETGGTVNVHLEYKLVSVASRFAGGPNEIKVQLYWTAGAGTPLRFRLLSARAGLRLSGFTFIPQRQFLASGTGAATVFTFADAQLNGVPDGGVITYRVYVGSTEYTYDATPGAGEYSWAINASNEMVITFGVAPVLGVNNIVLQQESYLLWGAGATVEYEGSVFKIDVSGFRKFNYPTWTLNVDSDTIQRYLTLEVTVWGAAINLLDPLSSLTMTIETLGTLQASPQSRYNAHIIAYIEGDNPTAPTTATTKLWNYQGTGENETDFYLTKFLDYQLNLAGADDAGELPTASQDGADGGYITALSSLKDRLLVNYKGGTQLWTVSGLPEDHALLGFGPVGTGDQEHAEPRVVDQSVVLGMARGLMSLNLTGSNLDNMRDINLGEPIAELGFPQQMDAAYWPATGEYVSAVEMPDGTRQFLVFDHSQEQKINAWSRWTVAELPEVERFTMVPRGNVLYFRADGYLYSFDLDATDYIDAHDDPDPEADAAYESVAMLHFNHAEAPFRQKQCVQMEWTMRGDVQVSLRWNPEMPEEETGEVVFSGMTSGKASIPAPVWGQPALAPVIRSRDRTARTDIPGPLHEIEELGMWFIVRGR